MGVASTDDMHEYSIVSALLDRIEREASTREAVAVHSVTVRVGELSGVECELLESAFDMARAKTICQAASLEIVPVKATWACRLCGGEISRGGPLRCQLCDEPATMASGDEIVLERLEMEVP